MHTPDPIGQAGEWLVQSALQWLYQRAERKGTLLSSQRKPPDQRQLEGLYLRVCAMYSLPHTKRGVREAVHRAFEDGELCLEDYDDMMDNSAVQGFVNWRRWVTGC